MPLHPVRTCLLLVACLALASPAYAGWGRRLANTIPSLIKKAAVSLIQKEMYDLEQGDQNNYDGSSQADESYQNPRSNISQSYRKSRNSPKSVSPRSRTTQPHVEPIELYEPPAFDKLPLTAAEQAFAHGAAGSYSFSELVSQKVFVSYPLKGSVFKRQSSVKYIILHSTETASLADAKRVIQSWNNRGLRHPGAQFVVDRDGVIYGAADPDLATVHINTSKTLPGFTNDNSIGIEIVRAGKQEYTNSQLKSVVCLVSYLQDHYKVTNSNVTTHGHVQPSDRSDPVRFDLLAFSRDKNRLRSDAVAWSNQSSAVAAKKPSNAKAYNAPSIAASAMPPRAPDYRTWQSYPQPTFAPQLSNMRRNTFGEISRF